jgi:hypothetical protein
MVLALRVPRRFLTIFIALLIAVPSLWAQSNYGAIRGIITDAQGAVLPKSQVTLTSATTNIARSTVSNGAGEYTFSAVDPGTYTVTVEMSGFQKLERKGIIIDSGNTIPLDLTLTIGSEGRSSR